ncbi:glycosyltransferase family 2 protein [Butyrivibrio sp. AE2015]|uniref:glycosyltransferase family 2 protein n=1 Tax=Butyrivibrio sp. AE2015 TaxID=1280663 RepID=UPI0003B5B67C|nr:glycosyltransferase family 2 protein [Butyrivibrio sp. AE2015]
MGEELLSVIVPIYNVVEYLDACIQGIISSSYANIEVILVDDGSTDGSGELCDRYAREDNRIKVIHKENGGLVSARKAGVEIATGKWTNFIDGDDYILSDYYEKVLPHMRENNVEMVVIGYTSINFDGTFDGIGKSSIQEGIYSVEDYDKYLDNNGEKLGFIYDDNKIYITEYLKEAIKEVNNDVIRAEDLNLTLSYMKYCRNFYVDNSSFGYQCVKRKTSITHTYDKESIKHTANYIASSLKLIEDKLHDENSEKYNRMIYNAAFNIVMSDCIGCTFYYYGKKRILQIVKYFKDMANNDVIRSLFENGVEKNYFYGNRYRFALLMSKKAYFRALIMRIRKQVR